MTVSVRNDSTDVADIMAEIKMDVNEQAPSRIYSNKMALISTKLIKEYNAFND